ncbi:MAG: VOC family protein [Deltaproteobacteria bacterium]|nr:VOC family protein [Deltaproteobacteria bacterium]
MVRDNASQTKVTVIPGLRYRDAVAAVDWLCRAFGFEKHLVVPGENNTIAHAELTFGNGMIMLGSGGSGAHHVYDTLVQPPENPDAVTTQGPYVVVADADAHYRRAVAAGARIVIDIKDQDYGGRGYTCRDPEGNVWSFGTFDPWRQQ